MVDKRFLEMMYQQWLQGNEFYATRWMEFVNLAAHHNRTTAEEILKVLETCRWFQR